MSFICDNCLDLNKENNLIQYFIDVIETKDPYTQGHSHHVRVITEARGKQLDNDILDCFLSLNKKYLEALECNCRICRERRLMLEKKNI